MAQVIGKEAMEAIRDIIAALDTIIAALEAAEDKTVKDRSLCVYCNCWSCWGRRGYDPKRCFVCRDSRCKDPKAARQCAEELERMLDSGLIAKPGATREDVMVAGLARLKKYPEGYCFPPKPSDI